MLSPLVSSLLMGLLRYALFGVGVWLVNNGIVTEEQFNQLLLGIVVAVGPLLWMAWVKFKERSEKLTGMAMPKGTTEQEVKAVVAKGEGASVKTRVDETPVLTPSTGDVR